MGIIICPASRGLDLTFGSMVLEPPWEDSEVFEGTYGVLSISEPQIESEH